MKLPTTKDQLNYVQRARLEYPIAFTVDDEEIEYFAHNDSIGIRMPFVTEYESATVKIFDVAFGMYHTQSLIMFKQEDADTAMMFRLAHPSAKHYDRW